MSDAIGELLRLNSVDDRQFSAELYRTLMLSTFSTLLKEVDEANAWSDVRSKFLAFPDHVHVTKLLVNKYVGGVFRHEDYEYLCRLLDARPRKRDRRDRHSEETKMRLLDEQHGECPICHTAIRLCNSELDHIVPWSLVGDELKDNLQMLCTKCNRRKSATIDYALLATFFIKGSCK